MEQENYNVRENSSIRHRSLEHCIFTWEIANFYFHLRDLPRTIISPPFTLESSPVEWYLELNAKYLWNGENTFCFTIRLCRSLHDRGPHKITARFSLELKERFDVIWWKSDNHLFHFKRGSSCGGDYLTNSTPELPLVSISTENYKLFIVCKMIANVESELQMLREPDMTTLGKDFPPNACLIINGQKLQVNREFLSSRSSVLKKMFLNSGDMLEIPFYSPKVVLSALRYLYFGISPIVVNPPPIDLYQYAQEYGLKDLVQLITPLRKNARSEFSTPLQQRIASPADGTSDNDAQFERT